MRRTLTRFSRQSHKTCSERLEEVERMGDAYVRKLSDARPLPAAGLPNLPVRLLCGQGYTWTWGATGCLGVLVKEPAEESSGRDAPSSGRAESRPEVAVPAGMSLSCTRLLWFS